MAILGIDEVGRGPLAGPLVVGAVVFPKWEDEPEWYFELKDSKKLSAKKRERLAEVILAETGTGIGFVTAGEIDRLGMMEALGLGTRRAVREVQSKHLHFSEVVIDGNINFLKDTRLEKYTTTVIKGDDLIKEISAASIVAKQMRDKYMTLLAEEYPEYGFEKHVGYGTLKHREAILNFGLSPEHRRLVKLVREVAVRDGEDLSYVYEKEKKKNTTGVGEAAETAVVKYLEEKEHLVVSRNYKTKICEIDIVSVYKNKIYFTEVKYRKNEDYGGGVAAVDRKKLEKMKIGVEMFLKLNYKYRKYDPVLAVAGVTGDFIVKDWIKIDYAI